MKVGALCIKKEGVHFDTPSFYLPLTLIAAFLRWMQNYNTTPREISLPIDKKYEKHKLTIKTLTKGIIFGDLFLQKNTLNKNNLYEKLV